MEPTTNTNNSNKNDNQNKKRFKLISYYKSQWETAKKILLDLKSKIINTNYSLSEKFQSLYLIIQNFQIQNRTSQYILKDLKKLKEKKCIGLEKAIKSYFSKDESFFYAKLLPFIIDQAILIEERANEKYGEQTLPLMTASRAMKESFPKLLVLSILANNFFCNDKDYVSQLTPKEKEITTVYDWNIVDWFALYSLDNSVGIQ